MISVFVPGPPVPKGSVNAFIAGGVNVPQKAIVTHSRKSIKYEKHIKKYLSDKNIKIYKRPQAVYAYMTFYLERPKSVPKSKRDLPSVRPDLDKYIRCVLDALTGIAFEDDAQVTTLYVEKVYESREQIGVRIEIGVDSSEGK